MNLPKWLALWLMPGLGPVRLAKLMARFKNPDDLFSSAVWPYKLSPEQAQYLSNPNWRAVEAILKWSEQTHHHLLTRDDPDYPPLLNQIHSPPQFLFILGDKAVLTQPQIAMVGSRRPSSVGLRWAKQIAMELSEAGLVVTSGMALGVDAASHHGALQVGKPTIAVLGTGVDRVYPKRHQSLYEQIATHGAVVSEFPLMTAPSAQNFPRRNRIISGLSLATVVVEAAERSGSLITAYCALEQGREVMAMPGPVNSPVSKGCHQLIKQGAGLVETRDDITAALPFWVRQELSLISSDHEPPAIAAAQSQLVELIDFSPTQIDHIIAKSQLPAADVMVQLQQLVLQGVIEQGPGGYIRLS